MFYFFANHRTYAPDQYFCNILSNRAIMLKTAGFRLFALTHRRAETVV